MRPGILWLVLAATLTSSTCGCGGSREPASRASSTELPSPSPQREAPARSTAAEDAWVEIEDDDDRYCLPGETEICGCPGGQAGSRRCNSAGTAFGDCDKCPSRMACGQAHCELKRLDALALSLSPCCPPNRADRCGVDVSHFAALHDYNVGCLELDAPGMTDPHCPSVTVMTPSADTVTLAGCRTRSGQCGYDVRIPDLIDLGCTTPPQRKLPAPQP